jgi:protein neuralized
MLFKFKIPTTHLSDPCQHANLSAEFLSDYDENTINRGTLGRPKPLLKFHSVCGTNIQLLREGRVARRRESFCKGLAFSNRPISIDEIVCIRLCEVGTNWSGVMRFVNRKY